MASLLSSYSVFRGVASWYVGTAKNTTSLVKSVSGIALGVTSGPAGGAYTAAEQTIINDLIAAINNDATLLGDTAAGVNQLIGAVSEMQRTLVAIAKIVGATVAARNSEIYRGAAPTLAAPGASDFATFGNFGTNSSRVNLGETAISPANVASLVVKWATEIGAPVFMVPTVANDILYFADAAGVVYAAREGEGGAAQILWKYQADQIVLSSITITADACIVFDYSGHVHVINRADGTARFKLKPNAHPAATFFGGQGTVDPVRGWVYFGVPSFQETLIALDHEGVFNGAASINTGSIGVAAPGVALVTLPGATPRPFTNDDLYREITISGAATPENNLRQGFIIQVISPTMALVVGDVAAEVFGATATYLITSPWARFILGTPNDPPLFSYPIGGSFVSSVHALDPSTGKIMWNYHNINSSNFVADAPGTPLPGLGTTVVANLPGTTFGYPPGVPSANGYNVYDPGSKATDVQGNPRYSMGPSGGDVWGCISYDPVTDLLYVPTGEQQAPPFVGNGATNGVVCLNASDGTFKWGTTLASNVARPDIWDDGIRTRSPNLANGNITSISAPDADGFQTLVVDTIPFTATDGLSGHEIRIAGAAAENNGAWAVAEYVANNTLKVLNPGGVAGGALGTWILNRIYDLDQGGTPHIVTTAGAAKYIVCGGKDGRINVLNPLTGAVVVTKQLIQMGLLGGFQTASAHLNDVVFLVGTDGAQVGREGTGTEVLNVSRDILEVGPAVIVAVQISDLGVPTVLWKHSIANDAVPPLVIETGPNLGQVFTGRFGFGVFAANGVIYIQPSGSTKLYAISMATGLQLAVHELNQHTSAVGCISNGKIIIPSGIYLPPNFRFPPQFNTIQPYGNITVLGLPS